MKLKHVDELEGLRGLMALWVVIGHWATSIGVSFAPLHQKLYNSYAVDVFIILSGFVIAFLRDQNPERYTAYLTRRFFRLFPVYLLILIASALLLDYARDAFASMPDAFMAARRIEVIDNTQAQFWPHMAAHLVLLHGLIPERFLTDTAFAFVGQAWSISVEWQFYLIAPLLLALLLNPQKRSSQIGLLVMVACCLFYKSFTTSAFIGPHLYLFAIGIGSFQLWKSAIDSRWLQVGCLRAALALSLLAMMALGKKAPPLLIWCMTLYVILASKCADAVIERKLVALLRWRPVLFLGRISYSVYLSHMLVIAFGLNVIAGYGWSVQQHALALFVIAVGGTVLLSTVLYYTIERPCMNLAKALIKSKRAVKHEPQPASMPDYAQQQLSLLSPADLRSR